MGINKPILLVEDNPDDVELTLRAFKKSNVANNVIVARDGEEALEYLFGEKRIVPSVVLLDLKLPKIDGLEVLRRIRADEMTKLYPVVILTSSKEDKDLLAGYKNGANSYIRKPVDFDRFMHAMHNLGMYWLVLNEPPPCQKIKE
ncbi:MAG: two-component system response regulator [Spirochaetes bacterium RBG_13_51_14]|nr:MAG: two-component system response regulator [Spirochaetes bacterium RBG_13_51_14]